MTFVLSGFSTCYCLPPDNQESFPYLPKPLLRFPLCEPTEHLFKILAASTNPHPPHSAFWISLSCLIFFHSTYFFLMYL